jgi:hypothetical protein
MENEENSGVGAFDKLKQFVKSANPDAGEKAVDSGRIGRNRKIEVASVDPEKLVGSGGRIGSGEKRKPGRPPGSGKKAGPEETKRPDKPRDKEPEKVHLTPEDFARLEALFLGIHQFAAAHYKTPEIEIDKEQAHRLSDTTTKIYEKYLARYLRVNGSGEAWDAGVILTSIFLVYWPNVAAYKLRRKLESDARKVQPLRPVHSSSAGPGGENVTR